MMKLLKTLGRVVLGILALFLLIIVVVFVWWRFGDWQARSIEDVEFIHENIQKHHPGPVDPENPAFAVQMEQAYSRARALAEDAKNPYDHHAAVQSYTDTFNDGHLNVFTLVTLLESLTDSDPGNPMSDPESGIDVQDNRAWITITSFSTARASIVELTEDFENRADSLRSLDTIVFDLRGNRGGSSSFGDRIATALWTEEVFNDWVPVSAAGVDWRASPENAEHVHSIAARYAERGRQSTADAWTRTAEGIDAAVAAGEDLYRQDFYTRETTKTVPNPVTAQVVVITDGKCGSACLDFMDVLMSLPNVLHIGEETSSDTQYIETRPADSPSRFTRLVFPVKVYRDRLRPPGGTYVPSIEVDTDELDWEAVEALVGELEEEG